MKQETNLGIETNRLDIYLHKSGLQPTIAIRLRIESQRIELTNTLYHQPQGLVVIESLDREAVSSETKRCVNGTPCFSTISRS